jgi:O-antigen ligase
MSIAATMGWDKARLCRTADAMVIAVAAFLPWSTSAVLICVAIWFPVLLSTLDVASVRREIAAPAGGLPVLLFVLGGLGMLWADVTWSARIAGYDSFIKLLAIPFLLIHFRRSDRGLWVFAAFLVSCAVLLAASSLFALLYMLNGPEFPYYGVPVKDYIAQSGEFTLCSFAATYMALDLFKAGRRAVAIALLALSAAFFLNIFYVATGRTAVAIIPILFILFSLRYFGWKGMAGILAAGTVLAAIIWSSSPYLRDRVTGLQSEVQSYRAGNAVTSAGERLEFWKKSLRFIVEAPVIGHGTGSIAKMFQGVAGETGVSAEATTNPHNQIFGVAIQLGLLGASVLLAMWLSHLLLFWRQGLVAWIGLVVVIQNIVASLFNSHLFDFTQGWLYVFGVGVAGGMVLRRSGSAIAAEGQVNGVVARAR